ncbi:hypothetical protein LTR38_007356 [Friedmanniomyces endolithicus]|nr:hypothetical protein LTR38_007356 [Friedmanniomyces endolithicus]
MTARAAEEACNSCSTHTEQCEHHTNGNVTDIEDYRTELSTLRARTKELEEQLSSLQTESSKPLRSAQWLNRPDDLAMSALSCLASLSSESLNRAQTLHHATSTTPPSLSGCEKASGLLAALRSSFLRTLSRRARGDLLPLWIATSAISASSSCSTLTHSMGRAAHRLR